MGRVLYFLNNHSPNITWDFQVWT